MDKKNTLIILLAVAFILVAGIVYWFFISDKTPAPNTTGQNQAALPPSGNTRESLGGQIYEQAQNPIQNKLPSTNPIQDANPIENIYTNPFD